MIKIYTKNKNVKQVRGVYLFKNNKICRLKVQSKIDGIIRDFISYGVPALITKDLPMQSSSKQTHVVKIDKLDKVEGIKVDNGTVISFKKDGDNLTIVLDNGSVKNQYNSQKYSRYKTKSVTSSSNSFSSSISQSEDGYSGTLTKNGSSKVISGSYDPGQSKTATDSRTSSSDSFPSSVSYSSGGYSGTLTKSGSSSVTSGSYTPEQSRTETSTETRASNKTGNSVSQSDRPIFPIGVLYNTGGYKGTLTPVGELHQIGGDFIEPKSTEVIIEKEDGAITPQTSLFEQRVIDDRVYSGNLSYWKCELLGGEEPKSMYKEMTIRFDGQAEYKIDRWDEKEDIYYGTLIDDSMRYEDPIKKSFVGEDGRVYTGLLHASGHTTAYHVYARDTSNGNLGHAAKVWSYAFGTDIKWRLKMGEIKREQGAIIDTFTGTLYTADTRRFKYYWKGTISSDGKDTRVWKQNYSGTVTKPSSDTRTWKQNYSGTVYRSGSDTRVWQQDYSGYIYKGGYDDYYKYKVDINCKIRKK